MLIGVELPWIALWAYEPIAGEVVCGIGRLDSDGSEQRVWFLQLGSRIAAYPRRVIGTFLSSTWGINL